MWSMVYVVDGAGAMALQHFLARLARSAGQLGAIFGLATLHSCPPPADIVQQGRSAAPAASSPAPSAIMPHR